MKRSLSLIVASTLILAGSLAITPLFAAPGGGKGPGAAWRAEKSPSSGAGAVNRPGRPGAEGNPGGPLSAIFPGAQQLMAPFWENERLAGELNLTEEQVAQLTAARAAAQEALVGSRETVAENRTALMEELGKDSPNLDAVLALHAELGADRELVTQVLLSHVVTVKNILTADQEQVVQRAMRNARPGGFGGPGAPGGPGLQLHTETIREMLQSGGTIEDVRAYLTEEGVPAERIDQVVERIQQSAAGPRADAPGRAAKGQRGPRGPKAPAAASVDTME